MAILTIRELLEDPTRIQKLYPSGIPEWVDPLDYDPMSDHHPDNLEATLERERFLEIAWDAIDQWEDVVWTLQRETGEFILIIL